MTRAEILSQIESTKTAIAEARDELSAVLRGRPRSSRADKVEIGEEARAAFARLRTARAELTVLLERSSTLAEFEAAEALVEATARELDRVLAEIPTTPGAETRWVSDVVDAAFTKLRAAMQKLEELEVRVSREED